MQGVAHLSPVLILFTLVYLPAAIILPELVGRLGLSTTLPGDLLALVLASYAAAFLFVAAQRRVPGPDERRRFALTGTLVAVGVSGIVAYVHAVLRGVDEAALAYIASLAREHGPSGALPTVTALLFSVYWLARLCFGEFCARCHSRLAGGDGKRPSGRSDGRANGRRSPRSAAAGRYRERHHAPGSSSG